MKTNKGTGKDGETKTPRITFSVSKEFEAILPEIDSMPNMSRFVCEAIQEKLQRVKNPNKDLQEALSHFMQIQQVIGGQQAPQANHSGTNTDAFQNPYATQPTQQTAPPPVYRAEETVEKKPEKVETPESVNEVENIEPDATLQEEVSTSALVDEHDTEDTAQNEPETAKENKNEEDEGVLSELQKNFLKPRTPR